MNLIVMNFLRNGLIGLVCLSGSSLRAENFDHEQLTTVEGTVYHDLLVMGTDEHGLTFRHRTGIAKVSYGSLSEAYRMFYEPVADLDDLGETDAGAVADTGDSDGEKGMDLGEFELAEPVLLTARTRIVVDLSQTWSRGCAPAPWPSWWPAHAHGHRLAFPRCRELAVRDFLFTTGLARPYCFR